MKLLLACVLLGLLPLASPAWAAATISVTDYGADPTGATNSTHAFTSAINAVDTQGGGTLVVPAGVYTIDPDTLNIHSHTTVAGPGATIRSSGGGYNLLGLSGSSLEVDGLTVDGGNVVLHVVEIGANLNAVTMRGTTIVNGGQSSDPTSPNYSAAVVGVRVEGGGLNMVFDSIHVQNMTATHSNGTSMIARGLLLDNSGASTVTKQVQVINSSFREVGPKDDGDCLVIQNSADTDANLLIQNNTFDACHKRAIKLQVGGVNVVNNRINNPFLGNNAYQVQPEPSGGPTFDMFAAVAVHSSNITISQNVTSGPGSFYQGIELAGTTTLQNVTITGNSIGNGPTSRTDAPSSLVRSSQPVHGLSITSNTFTNAPYGVYLEQPVEQATIQCNTYVMVAQQSANANGTEQPCTTPGGTLGGGNGGPGVSATPELDSLALFGVGLAGAFGYWRLRRDSVSRTSK